MELEGLEKSRRILFLFGPKASINFSDVDWATC
jgi:hypothetical protein